MNGNQWRSEVTASNVWDGQSGTRFYQPQHRHGMMAGQWSIIWPELATNGWPMLDRSQISGPGGPRLSRQFCKWALSQQCRMGLSAKWDRAEWYIPGTTYTGEIEEGLKLQEVGRRHGTNCPGVLIELSKWVIKYRVSRIKIHRSNLDSRFLPCRKKVLILTIYQPLGAHPLNLLATKIIHLFPHL